MTPISRSPGVQTIKTTAGTAANAGSISVDLDKRGPGPAVGSVYTTPSTLNFDIV